MDANLRKILYLSLYDPKKSKQINESQIDLMESKATEGAAQSILDNGGAQNAQHLISQFKQWDGTKNQILLPIIAQAYLEHNNLKDLEQVFTVVSDAKNKKNTLVVAAQDGQFVLGDRKFPNFDQFSDHVLSDNQLEAGKEYYDALKVHTDEKPIHQGNDIEIYAGSDVGRCIKYGTGYSFCIAQPGSNNMYHSYRNSQVSSFYYVFDKTRDKDDPLHLVVVDHNDKGFELTDANNTTGTIAEFGKDVEAYLDYLEDQGVRRDIFTHNPKTKEEEAEQTLLGKANKDLQWFKELNFKDKSRYVGRGHLLSDEQFAWLWQHRNNAGGFGLLKQYLNTGQAIPEKQFELLTAE